MANNSTTNFDLTPEQEAEQDQARQQKAAATEALIKSGQNGSMIGQIGAAQQLSEADRKISNAGVDAQAQNAGVQRSDVQESQGGIGGVFGATKTGNNYSVATVNDPNADANKAAIQSRIAGLDARPTLQQGTAMAGTALAQAAQANTAPQNQFRSGQMSLANALMAQANGQGPSLAQGQFQRATDANIRAAASAAASARGVNPAVAARMAADQQASIQQDAAGQSAQIALQEQQQARAQLGEVLNAGRSTDVGLSLGQAGMDQQTNLANAGAENTTNLANASAQNTTNANNLTSAVQQQQQHDQFVQQYLQMGMSQDQAEYQAKIQQAQYSAGLLAQQEAARNGIAVQNGAQATQTGTQLAGATIGAIATGVASDKRLKKNAKKGDKEVEELMSALKPSRFEYKDGAKHGHGERLGIMAQDAEKAGLGRALVMNRKDGKHIDVGKALGAALAAVANLHGRVRKLEA